MRVWWGAVLGSVGSGAHRAAPSPALLCTAVRTGPVTLFLHRGHQGHWSPEGKGPGKTVRVKRLAPCPGCGVGYMNVTFTVTVSIAQNRVNGLTTKGLFPEK